MSITSPLFEICATRDPSMCGCRGPSKGPPAARLGRLGARLETWHRLKACPDFGSVLWGGSWWGWFAARRKSRPAPGSDAGPGLGQPLRHHHQTAQGRVAVGSQGCAGHSLQSLVTWLSPFFRAMPFLPVTPTGIPCHGLSPAFLATWAETPFLVFFVLRLQILSSTPHPLDLLTFWSPVPPIIIMKTLQISCLHVTQAVPELSLPMEAASRAVPVLLQRVTRMIWNSAWKWEPEHGIFVNTPMRTTNPSLRQQHSGWQPVGLCYSYSL